MKFLKELNEFDTTDVTKLTEVEVADGLGTGGFEQILTTFGLQLGKLIKQQAKGDPEKMKMALRAYGKKTMGYLSRALKQVESGKAKLGSKYEDLTPKQQELYRRDR